MADTIEPWRGQTYYGRPQLKPSPFNNWIVGGYIFLAGLGGNISLLSGLADLAGLPRSEEARDEERYLPLLVPTLGATLLVYDLHTPQRFYNMLRVAKGTSPMSIGTWLLSGYSLSSMAGAALRWLSRRRPGLHRAEAGANLPAATLGAGMGIYTASLLAATSTPLWAVAPRALGARFAAASAASAASALSLMSPGGATRHAFDTVTALALATELASASAQSLALQRAGISSARSGGWELAEQIGATGAGAALPLILLALSGLRGGRGNLSRIASTLVIGGSLLLRVSLLAAGRQSALDPATSLRFAQPDNLPRRRARRRRRRTPPPASATA